MVQWILQRNQQIFLKSSNRTSSLQMNSRAAVKVKKRWQVFNCDCPLQSSHFAACWQFFASLGTCSFILPSTRDIVWNELSYFAQKITQFENEQYRESSKIKRHQIKPNKNESCSKGRPQSRNAHVASVTKFDHI